MCTNVSDAVLSEEEEKEGKIAIIYATNLKMGISCTCFSGVLLLLYAAMPYETVRNSPKCSILIFSDLVEI